MKRYFLLALVVTMAFGTVGCVSGGGTKDDSSIGSTVGDFGSDVAEGAGNFWDRLTGNRIALQIPSGSSAGRVAMIRSCAKTVNRLRAQQGLTEITLIEPEDHTKEMKAAGTGVGAVALGAGATLGAAAAVPLGMGAIGIMQPLMQKNNRDSVIARTQMDQCVMAAQQRQRRGR